MADSKISLESILNIVKPINTLDILVDACRHADAIGIINSIVRLLELHGILYGSQPWMKLYRKITTIIRHVCDSTYDWMKGKINASAALITVTTSNRTAQVLQKSLEDKIDVTGRDQADFVIMLFDDANSLAVDMRRAATYVPGKIKYAVVLTDDCDFELPDSACDYDHCYTLTTTCDDEGEVRFENKDVNRVIKLMGQHWTESQKSQSDLDPPRPSSPEAGDTAEAAAQFPKETWSDWAGKILDKIMACATWLKEASKSVVVKVITAVILACSATATFLGSTKVGARINGFGKSIVTSLKNLRDSKDMLPSVLDAASDFSAELCGAPELSSESKAIERIRLLDQDIEEAIQGLTTKSPITMATPGKIAEYETRVQEITKDLAPSKDKSGNLTNAICTLRERHRTLKDLIYNVQQKVGFRMKPTVIVLAGLPGVGKTTFVKALVKELSKKTGSERYDQVTFGLDHYDNYAGHPICVADEFGAQDLKADCKTLQAWADDTSLTLNCDALAHKCKQFCAQIIIVCTNHENIYTDCVFPEALARRIDYHIWAHNPQFIRWRNSNPASKPTDDELKRIHGNAFEMWLLPHHAVNWKGGYAHGNAVHTANTQKIVQTFLIREVLSQWTARTSLYTARLKDAGIVVDAAKSQMVDIPVFVFKGEPGTGKSTLMNKFSPAKFHIMDDVAFTSENFTAFMTKINRVENEKEEVRPIIATANGSSWDDMLDGLDPEKSDAIKRRVTIIDFSFNRRKWLVWWKAGEVTADNFVLAVRTECKGELMGPLDIIDMIERSAATKKPLFETVVPVCPEPRKADVNIRASLCHFVAQDLWTQKSYTDIKGKKATILGFVASLMSQISLERCKYLSDDAVIISANKSDITWTGEDIVVQTIGSKLTFASFNGKLRITKDGVRNFKFVNGKFEFDAGVVGHEVPEPIPVCEKKYIDWGGSIRAAFIAAAALVNAGFTASKDFYQPQQWNFLTDAEYDDEIKAGRLKRRGKNSRYDVEGFSRDRQWTAEEEPEDSWASPAWENKVVNYEELIFQDALTSVAKWVHPVFDALGSRISHAVAVQGKLLINKHALAKASRIGHKPLGKVTSAHVEGTDVVVLHPSDGSWGGLKMVLQGDLTPSESVFMVRDGRVQQFKLTDSVPTVVITDTGHWRLHRTVRKMGDRATVAGDCGSPYFVIRHGEAHLVGIHSSGNSTIASFARVTQDILDMEPQKSQVRAERIYGKTRLARHPLHSGDKTFEPAVLGKGDTRCPLDRTTDEIINQSVAPFLLPGTLPKHTEAVYADVLGFLQQFVTKKNVILTVEAALANQDLSSSPGLPFTRTGLRKSDLVERDVHGSRLRAKHKQQFMEEYGKLVDPTSELEVLVALKDELRKQEKIEKGATRLIFCSPIHANVYLFQHFATLFGQLKEHCWQCGVSVGVSPADGTWHAMYNYLRGNGGRAFTADFVRWDSTQSHGNVEMAMRILVELTGFRTATKDRLMCVLRKNLCPRLDTFPSAAYPSRGLLSGIFGTSQLNSVLNLLHISAAMLATGDSLVTNNGDLRFATYGDDLLVSVPKALKDWPAQAIRVYNHFQLNPTNAEKTGPPGFTNWEDATFLKRKFKNVNGIVMGALEPSSIWRTIEWLRTPGAGLYYQNPERVSVAPDVVINAGLQQTLAEAFVHGSAEYNAIRSSIISRAAKRKYRLSICIPKYEQFDIMHALECGNKFATSDFTAEEKQTSQTMDLFNKMQNYAQTNFGIVPPSKTSGSGTAWTTELKTPWGTFTGVGTNKRESREDAAMYALEGVQPGRSAQSPKPRLLTPTFNWTDQLEMVCKRIGVPPPEMYKEKEQSVVVTNWCLIKLDGTSPRVMRTAAKMALDELVHVASLTYRDEYAEGNEETQETQMDSGGSAPAGMETAAIEMASVEPTHGVEGAAGFTGQNNGVDPMVYELFVQTPTGDFTVSSNMSPGSDVMVLPIEPSINMYTGHLMRMYNAWAGSFDLRFIAAANNFIGGKLIAAILPPSVVPDDVPGTQALTAFPHEIIDIRTFDPVDIQMPDIKNVMFHRIGQGGLVNGIGSTLVIRVWSQLSTPDNNPTSVNCKLLSRPSQNFGFAFLVPPTLERQLPQDVSHAMAVVEALNSPRRDARWGIQVDGLMAVGNAMQQITEPLGGVVDLVGEPLTMANPDWPTGTYAINYSTPGEANNYKVGWLDDSDNVWDPNVDTGTGEYSLSLPPWFDWQPDATNANNIFNFDPNAAGNPCVVLADSTITLRGGVVPTEAGRGVLNMNYRVNSRQTGLIEWENNESLLVFTTSGEVDQRHWSLSTAASIQVRKRRPVEGDLCILMQMYSTQTGITGSPVKLYPEGFMTTVGRPVNTLFPKTTAFKFVGMVARNYTMAGAVRDFSLTINPLGEDEQLRDMRKDFAKFKLWQQQQLV